MEELAWLSREAPGRHPWPGMHLKDIWNASGGFFWHIMGSIWEASWRRGLPWQAQGHLEEKSVKKHGFLHLSSRPPFSLEFWKGGIMLDRSCLTGYFSVEAYPRQTIWDAPMESLVKPPATLNTVWVMNTYQKYMNTQWNIKRSTWALGICKRPWNSIVFYGVSHLLSRLLSMRTSKWKGCP